MGKATVIYKGVEKVSPKKYQWSIVYPSKNTQDAHDDEVYDYRNDYDYDYISRWEDDFYAELGL